MSSRDVRCISLIMLEPSWKLSDNTACSYLQPDSMLHIEDFDKVSDLPILLETLPLREMVPILITLTAPERNPFSVLPFVKLVS